MGGYIPLKITAPETGLVQNRQEMILPDDAFPVLQNAYIWRETIQRKLGLQQLARLTRVFTALSLGNSHASPWTFIIWSTLVPPKVPETNATIAPGSVIITVGTDTFTDQGNGTLRRQDGNLTSTINYITGSVTLDLLVAAGTAATINFSYTPNLPVMGVRARDVNASRIPRTVFFDTVYAYIFTTAGVREFIPGTTWTGNDHNFFWTTNYWQTAAGLKLFWATNFSGPTGDPIRYTDGMTWTNFAPQIDAAGNLLTGALALTPFRGRMLAINTLEGMSQATSIFYPQRIRWSAIGSPLTSDNPNAWRDDIRGQGGFINLPTTQNITAIGFVRDNLVIYCEGSTWQLRYTGRSIAPFQIEQVNPELGAESLFSAVQFDTSLVGIGDKGIVECDSFKSERIDAKILDLVFSFNTNNFGPSRIQGVRDFINKLAFWTYAYVPQGGTDVTYPNRRLLYNYENDSWAIFEDSITALGTFYPLSGRTWLNANQSSPPSSPAWKDANFSWAGKPFAVPDIVAGNQQGFIFYLDQLNKNDPSLFIQNVTGGTTPTVITSPNHNLQTGQIIQISAIPIGTPFADLNGIPFQISVIDINNFTLQSYNAAQDAFTNFQFDPTGVFVGAGKISVLDNFLIQTKKFNFLDQGQNIQLGFVDVLMAATVNGAITLNVYLNYNETDPVNVLPENVNFTTQTPDTFFNATVPTNSASANNIEGTKYWQRVYCAARGNFITLVWTLSNGQMNGLEQASEVEIDAKVIWVRPAGRMTNI